MRETDRIVQRWVPGDTWKWKGHYDGQASEGMFITQTSSSCHETAITVVATEGDRAVQWFNPYPYTHGGVVPVRPGAYEGGRIIWQKTQVALEDITDSNPVTYSWSVLGALFGWELLEGKGPNMRQGSLLLTVHHRKGMFPPI